MIYTYIYIYIYIYIYHYHYFVPQYSPIYTNACSRTTSSKMFASFRVWQRTSSGMHATVDTLCLPVITLAHLGQNLLCIWAILLWTDVILEGIDQHNDSIPNCLTAETLLWHWWRCNNIVYVLINSNLVPNDRWMLYKSYQCKVEAKWPPVEKSLPFWWPYPKCISALKQYVFEKRQTPQLLVRYLLKITSLYIWTPIAMNNNEATDPAITRSSKMMLCTQQCNTIES